MLNTLLLVAMLLTPATDTPPLQGSLCFNARGTSCIDTSGAKVEVAADDAERAFVWKSSDGTRIVLGTLAAKATSIDLESRELRAVSLSVRGDAKHGWPAEVGFDVMQGRKTKWEWRSAAATVGRLRRIMIPAGEYTLRLQSAHHRLLRLPIDARKDVAITTAELQPLPAVRGRVVKKEEERITPLAGAQVMRADGKVIAHTLENGAFSAEIEEPLPEELIVMHPGFGTTVIALRNIEEDNDLGDINLEAGATLRATVVRPDDLLERTLKVELLKETQKYEPTSIVKRELAAGEKQLIFDDVSPGEYLLIIEGGKDLESLATGVKMGKVGQDVKIAIEPFRLRGSARIGDKPLRDGRIDLGARFGRQPAILMDHDGKFETTAWQHGKMRGWVKGEALGQGLFVESPEVGDDPSEWTIALRDRLITGRIFDEATKQPLDRVGMKVQVTSGGSRSYSTTQVPPDGKFSIPAMHEGTYDLIVTHPERVPVNRTIEITEDTESQTIDIALRRGAETEVVLTWPDGRPVVNAQVYEGVARDGHNPARMFSTDGTGRLMVRSEPGERRTLWVIPQEGSLVSLHVNAPQSADKPATMRVVVPSPTGSMLLSFVDGNDKPAPSMLLMRYNGEWVPFPVASRLTGQPLSPGSRRLLHLPAGTYEIWGIAPNRDTATSTAAPPPVPPVRVGVASGEVSARVVVSAVP